MATTTTDFPGGDASQGSARSAGRLGERNYMTDLGHRLRSVREERGLTQSNLAAAAGVAPDMVSRLENGHYSSPGLRTLLRLAYGLGVSVGKLLPEHESSQPSDQIDSAARSRAQNLLSRLSGQDLELALDLLAAVATRRRPERPAPRSDPP